MAMQHESPLRVAVIGLGNMGRHHARVYSEMPGVELVALCDHSEDRLAEYSARFGGAVYTDMTEMLASESIDAASLVTPTSTHESVGLELLSSGVHLLIEKPIATTLSGADLLMGRAEAHGLQLMVGHIERFNPALQALKAYLDRGDLGELSSLIARRIGPRPLQIKDADVLMDVAVHDMDLFNYLLGRPPLTATANTGCTDGGVVVDTADILLDYGAASGLIHVDWCSPCKLRELTVTGSLGMATLDYMAPSLRILTPGEDGEPHCRDCELEHREPLRSELEVFVASVRGGHPDVVSAASGRAALAGVLALK